jgi:pimeloyl-ACP methyl ester carboxylesterase
MEIYSQAPERIERLALMDTTPLADAPENFAIRTRQIADVKAGKLDQVMQEELKPAYLVDSPAKPALMDLCLDMARAAGPAAFEDQALALRDRASQEDTLRKVDVPTLILCGRQDRLCPVERHEFMAALIPNATLEVIENAGHMPTLEQPEQTNAALARWLEER